jgi:hypothetical protein
MSGVHIFGWALLSTTDASRCTRKTFNPNVIDLSIGTMRSRPIISMPPSILASSCIGHSRARSAETASDGTSVICAGVNLPPTTTCEKLKSMEVTVCAKHSIAAMFSAPGRLITHSPVRMRLFAVVDCQGKSSVTRKPQITAGTTAESSGDRFVLMVLTLPNTLQTAHSR